MSQAADILQQAVQHHAAGDLPAAEAAYREAIRYDPLLTAAHNNLGNVLQQAGRLGEAESAFRAALQLQPGTAELHFNLGNCLKAQGHNADATAAYQQAVGLKPDLAEAHYLLGAVLGSERKHAESAACHREAVRLNPALMPAHVGLAVALQHLGQLAEARAAYEGALAIRPGDATAQYNYGTLLFAMAEYGAAERMFRAVTQAAPDYLDAYVALAQACSMRGDMREVHDAVERVVRADAEHAEARFFRGHARLAEGQWPQGWEDWEYRLRLATASKRAFAAPRWTGDDFSGQTLLVHAEYGLGDTLQFVRYVPLLHDRAAGGRVLVEVQPALVPLLEQSGFADLVAAGDALPPYDAQIPLLSLPGVFQTTLADVPGQQPYLAADPRLVETWRERLAELRGLRVGIHWQGNTSYIGDRHRSFSAAQCMSLAAVPDTTLVCLQKDVGPRQLAAEAHALKVLLLDGLDREGGAFMDTAAVMKNLDLVITSDTAIAHLAGGLGVPTWVALSVAPEWRWLTSGDRSPWYPSVRLFRQTALDDWTDVFARMAAELKALAREGAR